MTAGLPLVTLGVPVRNGAATLTAALDSIVGQDYSKLEVIISDNASTDATPEIARTYAEHYPFVRVIRHVTPLTAIDNFLFVMNEAKGEFFAWCAHDDTRSLDFVSGLLPAFNNPSTVLAFGDLYLCDGRSPPKCWSAYSFANDGLPMILRLRRSANLQCYHLYGLWRLSTLRSIRYRYTHWWSDLPLMLAASALGEFHHISGPQFLYYEVPKTDEARAAYQDNRTGNRRIVNFSALFRAIVITVWRTAGPWPAFASLVFVVEKYAREAFNRLGILLGASA